MTLGQRDYEAKQKSPLRALCFKRASFFMYNLLNILQSSVAVFIGLMLHGNFFFDVLKILPDAQHIAMQRLQEIRYHRHQACDNVQLKFVHA
jgi:hypothetical protein